MTVFHLDGNSSVRSSPEKHKYSIEELQMLLTDYRQWKVESRSSISSDSDVHSAEDSDDSEKADDIWDEEMLGDPKHGTGLLHDHCYTKRKTEKRVPSVSSECSNEADESLQHLFDTCDIDRDFLAEATLAHSHFLEDVLDIDDVPADDFLFFDFDESSAGSLVPAKESSSCFTMANCLSSVSTSSCIFTSAGSSDTVLSTRVAGLTSYNTHRTVSSPPSPRTSCCVSAGSMSVSVSEESPRVQVPLFDFSSSSLSSSSSSSSTLTSFSSDFPSHSSFKSDLATDCSGSASLDSKLKDVIDFLFSPTVAPQPAMSSSPNVTSFLEEMDSARSAAATKSARQPPLSFSDSDDSVWPVTLSHRIQNGACVSCCLRRRQSATSSNGDGLIRASDGSFPSTSSNNNNADTVLTCPTPPMSDAAATTTHLQQSSQKQQQQRDGDSSSAPSPRARSGKRKSCDTDIEECSLYPPVCGKQPRLGAAPSLDEETDRDEVFSPPSFPALSPVQSHPPAAPDAENAEWCDLDADKQVLAPSEEVEGLKKQSREVFDFLSAFSGSNTKLPLSPINVNHFGRCG